MGNSIPSLSHSSVRTILSSWIQAIRAVMYSVVAHESARQGEGFADATRTVKWRAPAQPGSFRIGRLPDRRLWPSVTGLRFRDEFFELGIRNLRQLRRRVFQRSVFDGAGQYLILRRPAPVSEA